MTKKEFKPSDLLIIRDLDALKTLSDPLRNQIMEILTPHPQTVNTVATKLGMESSKLYYHFSQLEKFGFIQVVETNIRGNLIEKHYWITAYQFDLDKDIFNFNVDTPEGTENIVAFLLANLDATRADIRRSMYARHQQISRGAERTPRLVFDQREIFHLPDEKAKEFHLRLGALLKEFQQEAEAFDPENEGLVPWALSIVLYPSFYFEAESVPAQGE